MNSLQQQQQQQQQRPTMQRSQNRIIIEVATRKIGPDSRPGISPAHVSRLQKLKQPRGKETMTVGF